MLAWTLLCELCNFPASSFDHLHMHKGSGQVHCSTGDANLCFHVCIGVKKTQRISLFNIAR
jgi:hypothetical protein